MWLVRARTTSGGPVASERSSAFVRGTCACEARLDREMLVAPSRLGPPSRSDRRSCESLVEMCECAVLGERVAVGNVAGRLVTMPRRIAAMSHAPRGPAQSSSNASVLALPASASDADAPVATGGGVGAAVVAADVDAPGAAARVGGLRASGAAGGLAAAALRLVLLVAALLRAAVVNALSTAACVAQGAHLSSSSMGRVDTCVRILQQDAAPWTLQCCRARQLDGAEAQGAPWQHAGGGEASAESAVCRRGAGGRPLAEAWRLGRDAAGPLGQDGRALGAGSERRVRSTPAVSGCLTQRRTAHTAAPVARGLVPRRVGRRWCEARSRRAIRRRR
jgi:hypothetical protein